eukprot:2083687-Pleurochrysis_carterae.AAC.1
MALLAHAHATRSLSCSNVAKLREGMGLGLQQEASDFHLAETELHGDEIFLEFGSGACNARYLLAVQTPPKADRPLPSAASTQLSLARACDDEPRSSALNSPADNAPAPQVRALRRLRGGAARDVRGGAGHRAARATRPPLSPGAGAGRPGTHRH